MKLFSIFTTGLVFAAFVFSIINKHNSYVVAFFAALFMIMFLITIEQGMTKEKK